jgi:hypothetical protein
MIDQFLIAETPPLDSLGEGLRRPGWTRAWPLERTPETFVN